MSNFLPEGYDKIPSTGRYMKLQEGRNVFRILSSAITGWVYWNTAGKPVRLKERPAGRPVDIRTENDGKENVKHFWAFAVWNYADNMVQVLEVTQKQMRKKKPIIKPCSLCGRKTNAYVCEYCDPAV